MKSALKILHLEDDPTDAELVESLLEEAGIPCQVVLVESRNDFVSALKNRRFDLIFSDYSLPSFDGISALEIAGKVAPGIPFILISGTQGEEVAIECLKSGATDYVLKQRMTRLVPVVRRAFSEALERKRRRRTEHALRESELRYRALFEESQDVIFFSDGMGRFLDINSAGVELFGYDSRKELLEADIANDLAVEPQRWRELEAELKIRRKLQNVEMVLQNREGKPLTVLVTANVDEGAEDEPMRYRGILRDVTDRRNLEKQLLRSQKMEAIGTLAGGIAHDFNNLLASILGYTEVALQDLSGSNPVSQKLQAVLSAANRARDLVKQILTFSRNMEQERRPTRLHNVVNEAIGLLRATLPASIEVKASIDEAGSMVIADTSRVHQVVMNLCTNAFHAMREGGGVLSLSLKNVMVDEHVARSSAGLKTGPYVQLMVSDTGSGMDKETLERMFDPFFTTKSVGEGTGLGLSAVHGIVTSHDGVISVYSEPGVGTTFHIYFPAITAVGEEQFPTDEAVRGGNEHILFVDDEPPLAELGKEILERLGYQVTSVVSSTEALESFRSQPAAYDLVITDQVMPHMNGIALAREITQIKPRTPILLLTGLHAELSPSDTRNTSIRERIIKPVGVNELGRIVRRMLEEESKAD